MMLSLSPFVRSSVHLSFFSLLFLDFVVHLECQKEFEGSFKGVLRKFKYV